MSNYNTPIYCSLISAAHRIFTSACLHKTKKNTCLYMHVNKQADIMWPVGEGQWVRDRILLQTLEYFQFPLTAEDFNDPLYTHVCLDVLSNGFRGNLP